MSSDDSNTTTPYIPPWVSPKIIPPWVSAKTVPGATTNSASTSNAEYNVLISDYEAVKTRLEKSRESLVPPLENYRDEIYRETWLFRRTRRQMTARQRYEIEHMAKWTKTMRRGVAGIWKKCGPDLAKEKIFKDRIRWARRKGVRRPEPDYFPARTVERDYQDAIAGFDLVAEECDRYVTHLQRGDSVLIQRVPWMPLAERMEEIEKFVWDEEDKLLPKKTHKDVVLLR